jgi:hypothetical protein
MNPQYTAQRTQDTVAGWLVTEIATGKTDVVFCSIAENTEADAVALIASPTPAADPA